MLISESPPEPAGRSLGGSGEMYGLSLGVGARHRFESHAFGLEVDGHLDPSAGPVGNIK